MPMGAHRGSRGIALLILNLDTRWCVWSTPRPGYFTPEKEPRYALLKRLGGPQGLVGWAWRKENLLTPQQLEPRTAQRIVSRPVSKFNQNKLYFFHIAMCTCLFLLQCLCFILLYGLCVGVCIFVWCTPICCQLFYSCRLCCSTA
jgi:hypothetical protein